MRARFLDWHCSQRYPFCEIEAIDNEEQLPRADNLNNFKRMIMEDFGFASGKFKSSNQAKARKELKAIHEMKLDKSRPKFDCITIDGAGTKCRDDGFNFMCDGSKLKLQIHVTDLTPLIKQGSVLDKDACYNVRSIYIPGYYKTMLPVEVAHETCSLNEGRQVHAITFELVFDNNQLSHYEIIPSIVDVK